MPSTHRSPSLQRFELVLASTNMHKIRELRAMIKSCLPFDLLSLCDFPDYAPPEETGTSFEENAILKAVHAAKTLHRWVIADDSGLVVPALGGSPGIHSRRYAGNSATDADNRKKLLDAMQHLLTEDRNAFFECCIALASPYGLKKWTRGACEGIILPKERGGCGFGFDPLFLKHGYNKTFSELEEAVKNRISHRRKALDKILPFLETIIPTESCTSS